MHTLINFIIVLGVLIFVHELGHFLVAKWVGIRVERFSLGFPPRAFGKKIGDTDYCISWLPLGGYVKLSGMIDESLDEQITGASWEYQSKSLYQRFLVIFAGPAMNYMLAVLIFAGIALMHGIATPTGPVIGEVLPELPASRAGLQPGDRILFVQSTPVDTWDAFTQQIHASAEKELALTVARGGDTLTVAVTPQKDTSSNRGRIGVMQKFEIRQAGVLAALGYGVSHTVHLTKLVGQAVARMLSGQESVKDSLAGPVGIARMVGEMARSGWLPLLSFVAFLSMQLAILNILPIPALDGGHIVFLLLEGVMRRPVPVKARMVFQQVGMALLLALMVFIIFNDIRKLL